jgi:hypothetical protein
VLVWKAVNEEPPVNAPESAAAEPPIAGDAPVFVVVTLSKPQLEITVPAASAERMNGIHCLGRIKPPSRIEKIVKNAKNLRFNK